MTDIAVIGGGIAGLSAAIYACRAGRSVVIFEGNMFGGQIVYAGRVENYPGIVSIMGPELADDLRNQAFALGAHSESRHVTGIEVHRDRKIVICGDAEHEFRSIIICTGTESRKLGLKNEELLTGRGVSYCAHCDGSFFKGKTVVIAGGGNTALDDGVYLKELCAKVYIVHRRSEFRGNPVTVKRLERTPNVEFILESEITALLGESELQGVTVRNKKTGATKNIACRGLFVAVGRVPKNNIFLPYVRLDGNGYIETDDEMRTATDGIFAAGDCRRKKLRQLVTAASDGAVAVTKALEYLEADLKSAVYS